MSGEIHLELVASDAGLSVHPSDRCRRPLSARGDGRVTYEFADGGTAVHDLSPDPRRGAWRGPSPAGALLATIAVPLRAETIEMTWPLAMPAPQGGR